MPHFQSVIFIWTWTYEDIFKSALAYLYGFLDFCEISDDATLLLKTKNNKLVCLCLNFCLNHLNIYTYISTLNKAEVNQMNKLNIAPNTPIANLKMQSSLIMINFKDISKILGKSIVGFFTFSENMFSDTTP